MQYRGIRRGIFIDRPNRFVARVLLAGKAETCHVKNTGRCRELLLPGAGVYLQECFNPSRKTRFDLIAVEKGGGIVNIDSQAPNRVAGEWLRAGGLWPDIAALRAECTHGDSRFDFYAQRPGQAAFLEVKGVTLEEDGVALFPDAPTGRGVKHLHGLIACRREGLGAYLIFVVQLEGARCVRPNDGTHPAFGEALRLAAAEGVILLALECAVAPDSLKVRRPLPLELG